MKYEDFMNLDDDVMLKVYYTNELMSAKSVRETYAATVEDIMNGPLSQTIVKDVSYNELHKKMFELTGNGIEMPTLEELHDELRSLGY